MQSIVLRELILPFVEFWRHLVSNGLRLNSNLDSFATFARPIIVPPPSRFRKNTGRPSPPRPSNLIEFSPRNVTRDKTINKTIKVTDSNPIVGSIANYRITEDFWEKVLREGNEANLTRRSSTDPFLPFFLPSFQKYISKQEKGKRRVWSPRSRFARYIYHRPSSLYAIYIYIYILSC